MKTKPVEYTDINIDGDRIVMTEKECPTGTKFLIGGRFFYFVSTQNVDMAFDFFKNYCPMLKQSELKKAWAAYRKARLQRMDSTNNAFWHYFEGKRLKTIGRKAGSFEWVIPTC